MRRKDTSDVTDSLMAVAGDALAVVGGLFLATWIRFDSGWLPLHFGRPPAVYRQYAGGILVAAVCFLLIFRSLRLYVRPQLGRFEGKIPRIVRASGLGTVVAMVLAFVFKNYVEYSTVALFVALPVVSVLVLLERYILFRIELHYARHSTAVNRVLILGADEVAARLKGSLEREPKLRSKIVAFLTIGDQAAHADVPADLVAGPADQLARVVAERAPVDQVILTDSSLGHARIVAIILFCEQHMVRFNMVPDLFRILTGSMDVQTVEGIPLLGVSEWPLDRFWNRLVKRAEDMVGALIGLALAAPVVGIAAVLIKRGSPGPVFFRQERCGEDGRPFTILKLRTMPVDAEAASGPVFTSQEDPRCTRIGAFLRRYNMDELPQFWNVLRGDMSLVGPRPERPHFVEQFKEDIGRYMLRHMSKPGLTGWAQVNGLRGNTSIAERIRYDLYYLENWSLAFDFKILARTLLARENAY